MVRVLKLSDIPSGGKLHFTERRRLIHITIKFYIIFIKRSYSTCVKGVVVITAVIIATHCEVIFRKIHMVQFWADSMPTNAES